MSRKLFGTDGVRGLANEWPMTPEIALQLGKAIAYVFRKKSGREKIIIGKDTRISGYMIEQALASGICSMGGDVYLVGPLPTPGIAFLTHSMRADAGAVISGSHNAYEDNGIKFFCKQGFKLADELEEKMEDLIFQNKLEEGRPFGKKVGKAHRIDDAIGRYVVFLKNTFPENYTLDGLRIVVDCAHGAGYRVAPSVFEELGAQVIAIGVDPNGENINSNCGCLHPEHLQKNVLQSKADLGIALDGDADRVMICDEKGNILNGDHILYRIAVDLHEQKKLLKNTVVATVMSNMGLELALKKHGIRMVRTPVGDRYVVEEMRKHGYNFGGEQSGHIVCLDHNTTGDGIGSALQVLAMKQRMQKPLSEVMGTLEILPQHQMNIRVKDKPEINTLKPVQKVIDQVTQKLNQEGRVLVRYSGTEPLARVMVEGRDEGSVADYTQEIADVLQSEIGA